MAYNFGEMIRFQVCDDTIVIYTVGNTQSFHVLGCSLNHSAMGDSGSYRNDVRVVKPPAGEFHVIALVINIKGGATHRVMLEINHEGVNKHTPWQQRQVDDHVPLPSLTCHSIVVQVDGETFITKARSAYDSDQKPGRIVDGDLLCRYLAGRIKLEEVRQAATTTDQEDQLHAIATARFGDFTGDWLHVPNAPTDVLINLLDELELLRRHATQVDAALARVHMPGELGRQAQPDKVTHVVNQLGLVESQARRARAALDAAHDNEALSLSDLAMVVAAQHRELKLRGDVLEGAVDAMGWAGKSARSATTAWRMPLPTRAMIS